MITAGAAALVSLTIISVALNANKRGRRREFLRMMAELDRFLAEPVKPDHWEVSDRYGRSICWHKIVRDEGGR